MTHRTASLLSLSRLMLLWLTAFFAGVVRCLLAGVRRQHLLYESKPFA
jgi:hypothetical protein